MKDMAFPQIRERELRSVKKQSHTPHIYKWRGRWHLNWMYRGVAYETNNVADQRLDCIKQALVFIDKLNKEVR